jgi:uncharacterized membrane protein YbhN (UPF0104 family)
VRGIRGRVAFWLKIAASAALVYVVMAKAGLPRIADSLRILRPEFGLALACSLAFTILKVLKWHFLVRAAAGKGTSLADAARSYLAGMAGGLLTPGRVGELARVAFLGMHGRGLVAYLVLVDRLFEVAAVVSLALPGVIHFADLPAAGATALLLAVLLAAIFRPELPLRWLGRRLSPGGRFAAAREPLQRMDRQIAAVSTATKLRQLGFAWAGYGTAILQFHFLLNNYHQSPFATAMLAQPLIMLTNVLPFTIGGLGVREGAAMVLLASFAIPRAAAVSASFMLFFLNTALPALAGALLLAFSRQRGPARRDP